MMVTDLEVLKIGVKSNNHHGHRLGGIENRSEEPARRQNSCKAQAPFVGSSAHSSHT